ncbi:restriction endonuclease fold toxin 5 domain-containing protein [Archangium lipolyticum]|uniref:restriction endonuclease fold toxin 5 domain-containing protein n=1 Tax=Archangium lipolyticum TaxID=2970465 RepID=UPI00214A64E3|nr:restriction endonuclease fold toxin 5 domain-containing protein [Archangium lipolyticum]
MLTRRSPLQPHCLRQHGWWLPPALLHLVALLLLAGCTSVTPRLLRGGPLPGLSHRSLAPTPFPNTSARHAVAGTPHSSSFVPGVASTTDEDEEEDVEEEEPAPGDVAGTPGRAVRPAAGGDEPVDDWGEGWTGWPDGVGDGRPHTVPMSVDYFQGFLAHVGVPADALPEDGRTLWPEQALRLLPHLLSTPVTLGNFAQRRMAAWLLLEVATSERPVSRQELHARMDRFHRLLVLRPDGYLVLAVTGEARQKVGEVKVAQDGTLRAGRYEVGPFYAIDGNRLWLVDAALAVPRGALPLGAYEPDDGVLLPALEGAALALADTVEGLYRVIFHPIETVEGLARLPGAVRELVRNAPEYWESFRHKPSGEQVRGVSRVLTGVVLMVGTAGEGAVQAATWGSRMGRLTLPVFSLTGEGVLALRLVAVPGRAIAVAGQALSATYVLHMASTGVAAAGTGSWTPPVGGPGQWVPKNEHMSARSRKFQNKVTKAPAGWVYRVLFGGEKADFDGFAEGVLLETKGLGYDKHFDSNLKAKQYFEGAARLVRQAARQSRVANGTPIRWHVAEPRMVDILKTIFEAERIKGIDVVYTPP